MEYLPIVLLFITIALVLITFSYVYKVDRKIESKTKEITAKIDESANREKNELVTYIQGQFSSINEVLYNSQKASAEAQDKRLTELSVQLNNLMMQNDKKLEDVRGTMERRLAALQEDNNKQLEKMRDTVDEKLQKTLEDKISQSFKLVSERLEQVYKGLGEMQTLASGVGDLKKVLSNVKSRGILGEIQLGAILSEILSKEQYEENVQVIPDKGQRVEFAVKLPGDNDQVVYLPIDAKFPGDAYSALRTALDNGNSDEINIAKKALETVIKKSAKDIRDKYIEAPYTTDFAIMFLPFEGLYAEVINMGLIETLQRDYKINIAGPTTMAALLNSLQMGFKTLAIQKHSSKVWDVLGAVKTEFGKFERTIIETQKRIQQANSELDKLVGTRTRMINSKLKNITSLAEPEAKQILEVAGEEVEVEVLEEPEIQIMDKE